LHEMIAFDPRVVPLPGSVRAMSCEHKRWQDPRPK